MVSKDDDSFEFDTDEDELSDEELEAQTHTAAPQTVEKRGRGRPSKVPQQTPEEEEDEFGRVTTKTPAPKGSTRNPEPSAANPAQRNRPRPPQQDVPQIPEQYKFCIPFNNPAKSGFIDPETGEVIADDASMMLALIYNKLCEVSEQIGKI